MKKSKAIIILLIILLITVGVGYIDFFGTDAYGTGSASDISLGLDLAGGVSITYQVVGEENPSAEDMADTIYKLQQRVENYSTEAQVYQEGANRISIEIPGVSDANAILEELGRPGTLYFIAQTDSTGAANYNYSGYGYELTKDLDTLLSDGSVVLYGTDVTAAEARSTADDMQNMQYVVSLTLTDEGKTKFANATSVAFAKGETIAIYYDGELVSVPRVNAAITDGNAIIEGNFTFEEAEKLASTIRIGGLSLELEELHSKVVGAQLGQDAISTSLKAGAIGFGIVAVFMIAVYFIPGLASVLALTLYIALVVLLLNGFAMTLTLSGVAGIILSIGMAVDANVVIFARIREELATGKTVQSSIRIGFEKALSAIIDGNVTTLIAAAVLWFLGPGSVKGFAQTLALGIVLSMFTALFVTKWIMQAFYALGLKSEKLYGIGKDRAPVKFLEKRKIFFILSAVLVLAGFVMMGVNKGRGIGALNFSLDFVGGTATTVDFNESYTIEELTSQVAPKIEAVTGGSVQIQTVQGTDEVIFKTNTLERETREALNEMFISNYGVTESQITSETISSTISNEMKRDTIIAVIVAIVFMLIYIRIRFKDIRFGVSSILALTHDVLVVLAFYAAARVSVSNTFVACMLTIVGYSINATIVIFDRIRENRNLASKETVEETINRSITQTLSRSIFTSLTTFVMVALLYILGVSAIRDFALPLMFGIVCGCYSSVCLAGAFWYTLRKLFPGKAKK
ncbi:MAG: protein translocase subunit SecD [Lachnospiraceae bacterium]|nr:protein translocase subunit SecD [Lachnospiraceae bacterium]